MIANLEEYFASDPWEVRNGACVVKGTNELFEAGVNGGPETKREALFDPRSVFDSLRVSFMRMTCGERLVRYEDALGEYLESEADVDGTAAVLEYLDRCRAYYDPGAVAVLPPWSAADAWPSFVYSMCDRERSV